NPDDQKQVVAGQVVKNFENLTAEQQKYVEAQYNLGFNLFKSGEYDKSLFEIRKVFQLVDNYKNSKEIERYAEEGKRKLEAAAEEKKREEEEKRIKARIAELM